MTVQKVTHAVIDLTYMEIAYLKDLLKHAGDVSETLGAAQERLRIDLLYTLPAEE